MSRRVPWELLAVIAVALALRLPHLDRRPMHNDEGVNALKFRSLWITNAYRYDPREFHGPTLPYATVPAAWLNGSRDFEQFSEATFRVVPVVFGAGLILILVLLMDGLGRREALGAGILTAVSPAMVFYSRYYIHEMLLVFFTALVFAAGWRYLQSRRIGWCLLAGAGVGLMHATKETFVFALLALGLGWVCNWSWTRWVQGKTTEGKPDFRAGHMALACLAAIGLSVAFFSSFFANASGPLDSLKTYLTWIHRAGGDSPHVQPWHFYLRRLIFFHYPNGPYWSEGLILFLAVAGAIAAFKRDSLKDANPIFVRTLAFYTLILAGIYTALPYKTPWCLLGFWHGAILLAGVGSVALIRLRRGEWLQRSAAILLAFGTVHLGWQAWRASYPYCASQLNPYVYAHTSPDVLNLVAKIEALSKFSPQPYQTVVKVMAPENDYWPLPWYLRRFPHVGWWDKIPADPFAPVMIVSSKLEAAFDERPQKTHLMAGYFQLRPRVFLELYVEIDLWRRYVESLPSAEED